MNHTRKIRMTKRTPAALITQKRGLTLTMTLRVVLQHDDCRGAVDVSTMILGFHPRRRERALSLVSRETLVPLHHRQRGKFITEAHEQTVRLSRTRGLVSRQGDRTSHDHELHALVVGEEAQGVYQMVVGRQSRTRKGHRRISIGDRNPATLGTGVNAK